MGFSQLILWAGIAIAAAQYAFARRFDKSLPESDTLPSWGKYGPDMMKRNVALYLYPWLQLGMTILLLLPVLFGGLPGGEDITSGNLLIYGFALLLMPLTQLGQVAVLRKWVEDGKLEIEGPKYPKWMLTPKVLVSFIALCVLAGAIASVANE